MTALTVERPETRTMAITSPPVEPERRRSVDLQAPWALNRLASVPPEDDQSGLRPIARYAPEGTDLDAIACVTDDHLIIYVTGLFEGRREVVGLEILQLPDSEDDGGINELMASAVENARRTKRRPVSAETMRRFASVGPALEFRQDEARESLIADVRALIEKVAEGDFPERRQAQMAAYLPDVLAYVYAIRERLSPAAVIAEARGVSASSANSRIARSRMFGLLTSPGKSVAAGEATPEAVALLGELGVDMSGGEPE